MKGPADVVQALNIEGDLVSKVNLNKNQGDSDFKSVMSQEQHKSRDSHSAGNEHKAESRQEQASGNERPQSGNERPETADRSDQQRDQSETSDRGQQETGQKTRSQATNDDKEIEDKVTVAAGVNEAELLARDAQSEKVLATFSLQGVSVDVADTGEEGEQVADEALLAKDRELKVAVNTTAFEDVKKTHITHTSDDVLKGSKLNTLNQNRAGEAVATTADEQLDLQDASGEGKQQEKFGEKLSLKNVDITAKAEVNTRDLMGDKLQLQGDLRVAQAKQTGETLSTKPITQKQSLVVGESFRSAQWSNAFNQRIVWMANRGITGAEIRLDPPDLGPVGIQIKMVKDQANLVFNSHVPAVREAIESALPKLREMLDSQGLQLGNTDISHQQQGEQSQQSHSGGNNQQYSNANEMPIEVQPLGDDAIHMGLIDYYA